MTGQELEALAQLPSSEVISALMAREEFTETLVRFNLEYLGFRADDLKYPDGSLFSTKKSTAQFPQAITSAVNVKADGDFFSIFSPDQPLYATPLSTHPLIEDEGDESQTMADRKTQAFDFHRQVLKDLAELVKNDPAMNVGTLCTELFTRVNFNLLLNLGLPFDFFGSLTGLLGPIGETCGSFQSDRPLPGMIADSLKHWDEVEVYLNEFAPETYKVTTLQELKTFDLVKLGLATPETKAAEEKKLTSNWYWTALNNSSTNYNRKRASYMLKRFFCDDLTPIAVETPAVHAEGLHASDPSCQACHYKLDPVAGFFRNHGQSGEDFSAAEFLVFDDGASTDRVKYVANWKKPDDSFDIGYIRSLTDESRNDRSSNPANPNLDSLFEIIRNAPEAQQCLVRTVFRYFVGETITIDAGYIEHLTELFAQDMTEHGSGVALKQTISRVLESNSFKQTNAVKDVCYDYAPGVDPAGLPPCKVARILEKNCISCHSASNAQGGLNLFTWLDQGNGLKGFANEGVEAKITFQAILDRLRDPDESIRMPLRQHMNSGDREALYLWVTEQINGATK